MLKNVFVILLFIPYFFYAQYSIKEIDSLLVKEDSRLKKEGKHEKAILLNKDIVKQSGELHYQKGIIRGYLNIGNALSTIGKHKESMGYLDLALQSSVDFKDSELESRIYGEYAKNYYFLGLDEKTIENYNLAIKTALNIADTKKRKSLLQYYYVDLSAAFEGTNKIKEFYMAIMKAYQLKPSPFIASRIAKYHILFSKNTDSAEYYLKKGDSMYNTGEYPVFQKSILLRNYGRLYYQKKEYEKAISLYNESVLISKQIKRVDDLPETYKLLYEASKALNDQEKAIDYLEKYTLVNDSLDTENKNTLDIPIKKFLKEKEIQNKEKENKLYRIILLLIVLGIIITLITYKILLSKKRAKEKLLHQKDRYIDIKQSEIVSLQSKINDSYEEVIQLAKENSPAFFGRFLEVYPNFSHKMLVLAPGLKPSELTLSAYIYLGFLTKDIAQFTFKAVKTIENNKYNLRKKLNVPEKVDFSIWLRNYIEGSNVD
ncbi:hypothetical protein CLU96_3303 [Chryseobacterium sp. 52]|uniref:hypothetical protein n=1 Tax=Chryseobacterium sp. 52 TaxID=2035213 RepID=UPI000C18184E|nr:hypothetical protein [Chryseobacterium sp. 52]PIF46278.1 hypothetical protein CLU96_3303 [Chryseobacterium sp. 52]